MNLKGIQLTWLGHSTFRVVTPEGKTLYIDPWIAGNPACPENEKNVKKADVLVCTHGHGDHIGDAVEVGTKLSPIAVGIFELCLWLQKKGVKQIAPMNKGGTQTVADVKITMVHAVHSCGIQDGDEIIYGGEACGYVLEFSNGVKLYHAGDTAVFSDMAIIRDLYAPKIVMLPIGDLYTMAPREAAYACNLLQPEVVIPDAFRHIPLANWNAWRITKAGTGRRSTGTNPRPNNFLILVERRASRPSTTMRHFAGRSLRRSMTNQPAPSDWRMGGITVPAVEDYLYAMLPPRDEVLAEMEADATRNHVPIVGPAVARVLFQLATISGAKKIFEMGSAIGYSTIWWARARGRRWTRGLHRRQSQTCRDSQAALRACWSEQAHHSPSW